MTIQDLNVKSVLELIVNYIEEDAYLIMLSK